MNFELPEYLTHFLEQLDAFIDAYFANAGAWIGAVPVFEQTVVHSPYQYYWQLSRIKTCGICNG